MEKREMTNCNCWRGRSDDKPIPYQLARIVFITEECCPEHGIDKEVLEKIILNEAVTSAFQRTVNKKEEK